MPSAAEKKKLRKPYTITRPREKWTADEHDRFLHALMLFGRDWKRIEAFVGTKTSIQIRSHAQKHFLKAQKFGLAACLPPPLNPRRAALLQHHQPPPPLHAGNASVGCAVPSSSGVRQSVDWACASPQPRCWPDLDSYGHLHTPIAPSTSGGSWLADNATNDETIQLPLAPGTVALTKILQEYCRTDLRFAQVYRFVGDVFGSDESFPVEAHLRRLPGMDPVVAETILMVLGNLEANLWA